MTTLNSYYFHSRSRDNSLYEVFNAYNTIHKKPETIIIHKQSRNEEIKKQNRKQKQILNSLSHPNIVSIQKQFSREQFNYTIFQYCSGGNLKQYLQQNGDLNEKQLRYIVGSLLKALSYIQGKNINHQDIKAQNIFIHQNNLIKLGYFNFSSFQEIQNNIPSNYLSPQILNNTVHEYNHWCDIWSLGVTIYQLYFGYNPMSYNPYFMQKKIIHYPQKRASDNLKNFIKCCLEYDIRDRMSASQLMQHPWIQSKEIVNLSPQKLDINKIKAYYENYYKRNYLTQVFKQYNNVIIRSINKFKILYVEQLNKFMNNYILIQKYLCQKRQQKLEELLNKIMIYRIEQMRLIELEGHLPCNKYIIKYHHDDLQAQTKLIIQKIMKSVVQRAKILNQSLKQLKKYVYLQNNCQTNERQLLSYLLQRAKDSQNYWRIISLFVEMIEQNLKQYQINYEYHHLIPQNLIKQINEVKKQMKPEEFQEIYDNSHYHLGFPKMDIMEYEIKPKNRNITKFNQKFFEITIPFIKQTISMVIQNL